jgi:hypothetical protein
MSARLTDCKVTLVEKTAQSRLGEGCFYDDFKGRLDAAENSAFAVA